MIEKLLWDSDFFKYAVGKYTVEKVFDNNRFDINKKNFKLIYVYAQSKLKKCKDCNFIEQKVTLSKTLNVTPKINTNISIFNSKIDSIDELFNLVLLSGVHSRFKTDINFKNNEFEALYKKWMTNCLSSDSDAIILVYKENNKILGFTTVESISKRTSKIGLIAVDENHQRKGIAKRLLNFAETISLENNCKNIEVTTQGQNKSAMNFYEKYGFNTIFTNYIYHYWNSL